MSRPPTVSDGGSSDSAADTTDLGALGDWDAEDYRRIRSAEQVWIPEDVALVVLRASDPAGPAAGVAGWGGVDGLGVLPVRLGYRVGKAFTSYDHLSHFDPAPAAVVVVRNRPSHGPLCQGMVVGVGRVRQHLVDGPGSTRVVEATADDEEVVALRRHLQHRLLVEPKPTSALAPFTLYPPPFGDYLGSRHAG